MARVWVSASDANPEGDQYWVPLGRVDHASFAEPLTLTQLKTLGPHGALASLAVRFGDTRRIDNITLP